MSDKKYILDRSDILALAAILISGIALGVSVYEANIMKDQQQIMFDQQQAAVWPYVDGKISYDLGDKFTITYSLINKGVGPAIIRDGQFMVNDSTLSAFQGNIYNAIRPHFPPKVDLRISLSLVSNKVLSPEEEYSILKLESNRFEGDFEIISQLEFEYDACFCSIYDECWNLKEDDDGKKLACE